jgi:hypothetical protein
MPSVSPRQRDDRRTSIHYSTRHRSCTTRESHGQEVFRIAFNTMQRRFVQKAQAKGGAGTVSVMPILSKGKGGESRLGVAAHEVNVTFNGIGTSPSSLVRAGGSCFFRGAWYCEGSGEEAP